MSNSQFSQTNPMVKNPSLKLVKLKGILAVKNNQNTLVKEIVNILKEIPNLDDFINPSLSLSMLDNICRLVENNDQSTLVDKKKTALAVITEIWPMLNNEKDLKIISQDIDEIVMLSKYVKKIPIMQKSFKMLSSYIQKKL